ncbi:MAG: hypothetical protein GX119_02820 [Syntrophomonadaceae bacterium]|nr:hypothetical protein [Syntrophomonadaceae bacterium]
MLAFGSAAAASDGGIFTNPLILFLGVLLSIIIFWKFCGWAKKFELSGGFKKIIFILTAIGLIGFNVLYSMGNAAIQAGNGWGTATIALLAALVWAFVFAFALMAETK